MKKAIFVFIVAINLATYCYGNGIVNGDFEYCDSIFSPLGWTRENYASVKSVFVPNPEPGSQGHCWNWNTNKILPFKGNSFLVVSNGVLHHPDPCYAKASQKITVSSGQIIEGVYFWGSCDEMPYNDFCYIRLVPIGDPNHRQIITLVYNSVDQLGVGFSSMYGWERFEHKFTSQEFGVYNLEIYVQDGVDYMWDSYLMVDSIAICDGNMSNIDLNCDCKINFQDFPVIAKNWKVDHKSLALVSQNWLLSEGKTFNFVNYSVIMKNNTDPKKLLYIISKEWLK